MLHQERIADVLENGAPAGVGATLFGQLPDERLDGFEHGGHFAFVARQHHALGKRIGNYDQMIRRHCLQHDRAAWKNLILLVGRKLDENGFFFGRFDRADQALLQAAQNFVFFRTS